MGGLGAPELLILLVIVLLFFGGSKLPSLARSLGESQREFHKGTKDSNEPVVVAPVVEKAVVVEKPLRDVS